MSNLATAVLTIAASAVLTVIGALLVRKKTQAETADVITSAATRLVEATERRLTDLERRLKIADDEREVSQAKIADLEKRLKVAEESGLIDNAKIADLERQVRWLKARLPATVVAEFEAFESDPQV